jgi:hypothetical protein
MPHPEDNDSRWEVIFSTKQLYKAEIFRGLLEEEGIHSVIINKQDSSYIAFGDIELCVNRDDVLNAIQIIERASCDE